MSRRWKFSREIGTAAITAGFAVLLLLLQGYGTFYSIPAEIHTVKVDVKELQKVANDLRVSVARIEERQKNDNRRASISNEF